MFYNLLLIFIFIFGLAIGSFLNCLIWRLHAGGGLWNRSYCPKCKHKIAWYDNIPIASFIILSGKCRHCHKLISWQYPVVEFITGLLFVISVIGNLKLVIWGGGIMPLEVFQITNYQLLITVFRDWFIISVMIVIFVYDLRWYLILDTVTLPAMAVVFILNLLLGVNWLNLLLAGAVGGGFFLIQFIISRGKWIGGGDIRLGLLLGLALGWPLVAAAVLLAYFIGSIVSVFLIALGRKKWGQEVPMGTFLAIAAIITLLWGEAILDWYFNLMLI